MHTNILRYEVINKYHVIIVQLQDNFNEQKKNIILKVGIMEWNRRKNWKIK